MWSWELDKWKFISLLISICCIVPNSKDMSAGVYIVALNRCCVICMLTGNVTINEKVSSEKSIRALGVARQYLLEFSRGNVAGNDNKGKQGEE